MKQSLHSINVKSISGEEQALSRFKGKVLLVVNVASRCGFTPQSSALQKLYEKYRDQGFCILAFPCNDFGRQEPAEDKEIEKFCVNNFGISFNLFSKVRVLGPKQSSLYRYLQESDLVAVGKAGIKTMITQFLTGILLKIRGDVVPKSNDVRWNFHKFLIDKEGFPVARYSSEIEPDSPLLVKRLEAELRK